jgi:uncharacterized membrane protein required for colicin V production
VNAYDVIVVVILVLPAVRGLRRGLIAMLIGLIGFAAAVVLAFRFDAALGALGSSRDEHARSGHYPGECE